jgi:hypothetical protein
VARPLIIEKGRFRLLVEGDCIRMDMDGGTGLVMLLTREERIALSKALWYATPRSPA